MSSSAQLFHNLCLFLLIGGIFFGSSREKIIFNKKKCPKRFFPSDFVKLGPIELRKMLLRRKLFDVRLGNCSTPKILIFCRFTGFNRWKVRLDTLFFQNEVQKLCFISWCWSVVTDPLYNSERIYNPSNFGIVKGVDHSKKSLSKFYLNTFY